VTPDPQRWRGAHNLFKLTHPWADAILQRPHAGAGQQRANLLTQRPPAAGVPRASGSKRSNGAPVPALRRQRKRRPHSCWVCWRGFTCSLKLDPHGIALHPFAAGRDAASRLQQLQGSPWLSEIQSDAILQMQLRRLRPLKPTNPPLGTHEESGCQSRLPGNILAA